MKFSDIYRLLLSNKKINFKILYKLFLVNKINLLKILMN